MSKSIFVFGDSIVYGAYDKGGGWVEKLKIFYHSKMIPHTKNYFVYNLGIPTDETTIEVLKRIEPEIKSRISARNLKKENIVIFGIGANDSQYLYSRKTLRISSRNFAFNIQKLIKKAQIFASNIVFTGLLPVDELRTTPVNWNKDRSYKNESIEKYNKILKSVCKDNKVYFIEIFESWIKLDYKKLLIDGLHPNSKGHQKIFETVKKFLAK